jgi:hypothetical protein
MADRKEVNKYIPHNYDPRAAPKRAPLPAGLSVVTLSLPVVMQCANADCEHIMAKNTRFQAKKEIVAGADYLGIKIHRFHIRCTACHSAISFRTDPERGRYVVEHGAVVGANPAQDRIDALAQAAQTEADVRAGRLDPLLLLEKRTAETQAALVQAAELEEMRAASAANSTARSAAMLASLRQEENKAAISAVRLARARQPTGRASSDVCLPSSLWPPSRASAGLGLGLGLKRPAPTPASAPAKKAPLPLPGQDDPGQDEPGQDEPARPAAGSLLASYDDSSSDS